MTDFQPSEDGDFLPSDLTVAGVRLGAVAVDAGPAVDLADGHRAQRRLVGPPRQADDLAPAVAVVGSRTLKENYSMIY